MTVTYPSDWSEDSLDSVADVIDPHPSHRAPPEAKEGIPFPGIGDFLESGAIKVGSCRLVDANVYEEHKRRYNVEDGDLGFGRVASIGKVVRLNRSFLPFAVSPTLAVLKPKSIDPGYLRHYLQSMQMSEQIGKLLTGTTRSSLGVELLRKLRVTAPTEENEQAKIAEVLSTLEQAIEQTETSIVKLKRVKAGLMQDLLLRGIDDNGNIRTIETHKFKDSLLGKIPAEWGCGPLGDVARVLDPNPTHRYPPPQDGGVPIASTENFDGDNDFDLSGCETVPWSVYEFQSKRCGYEATDVVFARKGRLGFARPYGISKKVFSHTVVIIKPRENKRAVSEFLLWVVRDELFFRRIAERMNSNSGVPTLGVQFLSAVPILVPSPEEQTRIAQRLSQAEALIEEEHKGLSKLKAMKIGLMHDLLTGKKRVTALLALKTNREKVYASQ